MGRAKRDTPVRFPEFQTAFNELMADMTIKEFADKLGMSRATVGFYSAGQRIPDALGVKTIAEKCDVSADWLLGLTHDKRKTVSPVDKLGLSEHAINYLDTIKQQECGNRISDSGLEILASEDARSLWFAKRDVGEADEIAYVQMCNEFSVSSREELIDALKQQYLDAEKERITKSSGFEAKLILDFLSALLENENRLHIIENLSKYVFSYPAKSTTISGSILSGNSIRSTTANIDITSEQLMGVFLLEAENSINKLKDLKQTYTVCELEVYGEYEFQDTEE